MNLENIIAISGVPGLYKVIGQSSSGLIVESIETKKRQPIYSTQKVSALEDICIYTDTEEVPLIDILISLFTNEKGKSVKVDNNDKIKELFETILPNYDKARVYTSDIKKVLKWYNMLLDAKLVDGKKETKETKGKDAEETKATDKKKKTDLKEKKAPAKSATAKSVPKTTVSKSKAKPNVAKKTPTTVASKKG
jgi:hypothetical protein